MNDGVWIPIIVGIIMLIVIVPILAIYYLIWINAVIILDALGSGESLSDYFWEFIFLIIGCLLLFGSVRGGKSCLSR